MPVPHQFLCTRPGDAGDVEADGCVLEDGEMPDVDDVLEIRGVGGGAWIGFRPTLVAGAPREFDERLPPVGVGFPRHLRWHLKFGPSDQLHAKWGGFGHAITLMPG